MRSSIDTILAAFFTSTVLAALPGCGSDPVPETAVDAGGNETVQTRDEPLPAETKRSFAPLDLNAGAGESNEASAPRLSGAERTRAVKQNLRPLLSLIGKWNGTINKKARVETVTWVYDVKTDEAHPGLKMTTKTGGYLQQARLTWLPDDEAFQLVAIENDGAELEFVGTYSVEPHDVEGDGNAKKTQRSFKLELQRDAAEPKHKLAKVVFNQRDNGRYLLELYDKRGRRFDTINTMREGRSFAVSEEYGEKECIISQGLGTISISYQGKTYWVCCSGCEAEFKADPEKWIAKYEAMKSKGE